ncbi:MAG: phage portal protein [Pseudonocardia sp.]|nr:phage portal protein [Pseudonocardia sp.]
MADLSTAVASVGEASDSYDRAWNYYSGDIEELFASPVIQRILAGSSSGYRVNLARRPVDAVLDRLKIASVLVPNNDPLTKVLNDLVWAPNRLGRVAKLVHRAALVYGDAYLHVWPGVDEGTVRAIFNSPGTTRVFYDPEDPSKKSFAAKVWSVGDRDNQQTRVTLYYADRIERWISKKGTKGDEEKHYVEFVDEDGDPWPIENPYGEIPVFHFRTDEPYGRPEHADAFGPQNAINKLVATQMASADYQGFPQRYRLRSVATSDLVGYPDDDDDVPDEGSALTASPGTVWDLTNTDAVGQFDSANPDSFLKPIEFYIRAMAAATATPLRFFDSEGQVPSGEALRADEAPLAEKIGDRQTWFGDEWVAALMFGMKVVGSPVNTVDIRWRPVQTTDDLEGWKTVEKKLALGVPFDQAMAEAGYLPEQVAGWTAPLQTPPLSA